MRNDRTQLALLYLPLVLSAVAILVAVVLFAVRPRRPMASKSDCDRIEIGMSRQQVEQILGGPPGDYRTRHTLEDPPRGLRFVFWEVWKGDSGVIRVDFDEDGWVQDKMHTDYWIMGRRSLLDRITLR